MVRIMGLTKDAVTSSGVRWLFCGEPYTFERYLTFCVEQLNEHTRNDMARLGLLGYKFKHVLPALGDRLYDPDGHWVATGEVGAFRNWQVASNVRLRDVVFDTLSWHIQHEAEEERRRIRGSTAPYA